MIAKLRKNRLNVIIKNAGESVVLAFELELEVE